MDQARLPDIDDVRQAARRLDGVATCTPLIRNDALDAQVGCPVFVKCETLQTTGSFKIRGAYNCLSKLSPDERANGVVAFSSGNHAQGVARAARLLGMPACIVMPHDTPSVKIEGVKRDGAEIVFYDRQTESREDIAARIASERQAVLVPSFDHPDVIAGQGSCGLEIVEQWTHPIAPQALVCCVGGGGLIAGISLVLEASWPDTAIWGAEPEAFDDHARSLASGRIESVMPGNTSVCDALLSNAPGRLTFAINQKRLRGVGLVSDDDVRAAMRFAFRHLKLVVEPGGAAALAAILAGKVPLSGSAPLVIVLTGGNVDPEFYAATL